MEQEIFIGRLRTPLWFPWNCKWIAFYVFISRLKIPCARSRLNENDNCRRNRLDLFPITIEDINNWKIVIPWLRTLSAVAVLANIKKKLLRSHCQPHFHQILLTQTLRAHQRISKNDKWKINNINIWFDINHNKYKITKLIWLESECFICKLIDDLMMSFIQLVISIHWNIDSSCVVCYVHWRFGLNKFRINRGCILINFSNKTKHREKKKKMPNCTSHIALFIRIRMGNANREWKWKSIYSITIIINISEQVISRKFSNKWNEFQFI